MLLLAQGMALKRGQLYCAAIVALCITIPFLFFHSFSGFRRLDKWLASSVVGGPLVAQSPSIDFYDWDTRSSFNPVSFDNVHSKTTEELCASFPTYLLRDIQPILKTGHGVLDARVRPQLHSMSECVSNLLIFSDLEEEYDGHQLIDVIADIPTHLANSTEQLQPYFELQRIAATSGLQHADLGALEGWRTDKFKFLTSISRAWRMRPERQWYVFYEADTYLVWDNVFRLLENFDYNAPLYFGSPSPGFAGTWFANGGPGYILSREAMRRLVADDWDEESGEYLGAQLTVKFWDHLLHDCCGDSVVGWALSNVTVNISGLWPMFNPHPPHGVPYSDLYWCQPVISMHKPREEDLEGLWRWQWEHRQLRRPLLYRDLATSYFALGNMSLKEDWDNADWDAMDPPVPSPFYTHDPHESFGACGWACNAHTHCLQYRYHLRRCTFVRSVRMGAAKEPGLPRNANEETKAKAWPEEDKRYMSGWATQSINKWMDERPCDKVQWVRPSIKRIF